MRASGADHTARMVMLMRQHAATNTKHRSFTPSIFAEDDIINRKIPIVSHKAKCSYVFANMLPWNAKV